MLFPSGNSQPRQRSAAYPRCCAASGSSNRKLPETTAKLDRDRSRRSRFAALKGHTDIATSRIRRLAVDLEGHRKATQYETDSTSPLYRRLIDDYELRSSKCRAPNRQLGIDHSALRRRQWRQFVLVHNNWDAARWTHAIWRRRSSSNLSHFLNLGHAQAQSPRARARAVWKPSYHECRAPIPTGTTPFKRRQDPHRAFSVGPNQPIHLTQRLSSARSHTKKPRTSFASPVRSKSFASELPDSPPALSPSLRFPRRSGRSAINQLCCLLLHRRTSVAHLPARQMRALSCYALLPEVILHQSALNPIRASRCQPAEFTAALAPSELTL